ncbi:putative protein OS=Sphingobium scionense OX=1404341 GN=GGQ90_002409 PE=4 SV=1 [Sphingobium scionense]|uniref:Uncharacterized protein n=1 Tax=Sphingobium scionense TaxID=1404341 RepID=A0A7W6LQG5_9SPHN|nr:hypothetical protein [Sphingobium scionense]
MVNSVSGTTAKLRPENRHCIPFRSGNAPLSLAYL